METNTLAYAKVVTNARLNTLRLLVTFDSTKRDKNDNIIVTTANAAYASGDLCSASANEEYVAKCVRAAVHTAQLHLRTDNIALA